MPQTGPYAEEGMDELRAQELAVQHRNGEGDGGMMNTFSSKALKGNGILGKKVEFVTGDAGFDFSDNFNNQERMSMQIIFCEIPKTATGKIQKFELRKQLN